MILALIAAAMSSTAPGGVERLVARLGLQSDYRSIEAIGRYGCRAVPALVRQLEVVWVVRVLGYEKERHPREIRVAWTIATLRNITGTDFYAPRPSWYDPDSPGGRFLTQGAPPDSTKFFDPIGTRTFCPKSTCPNSGHVPIPAVFSSPSAA